MVERRAEPAVGHHTELPRIATSVDSAIVRRRIRRPPEPRGDGEVCGGDGKSGGGNSFSPLEWPPPPPFSPTNRRALFFPLLFFFRGSLFHASHRRGCPFVVHGS